MDEASIKGLLKLWEERMNYIGMSDTAYADAMRDCIFELKQLAGICNQDEEESKDPLPITWY